MDQKLDWKIAYQKEINFAVSARANGNEAKARVCARRAAGIAIGEYLYRQGYHNLGNSINDRMAILDSLPNVDNYCKEIIGHLTLKVDMDHNLPVDADLINEVEWLAQKLLLEL